MRKMENYYDDKFISFYWELEMNETTLIYVIKDSINNDYVY